MNDTISESKRYRHKADAEHSKIQATMIILFNIIFTKGDYYSENNGDSHK